MPEKFQFADFKVTSQQWNADSANRAVVNPSSDNGRSVWAVRPETQDAPATVAETDAKKDGI